MFKILHEICWVKVYIFILITDMNLLKPSVPILNFMRFRGSRHPRNKLQKPEDKSSVILGKWKPSVAYPKPGVSDKAVSFSLLSCLMMLLY